MNTTLNAINTALKYAGADHMSSVIFGFDRITIWFDRPELPARESLLRQHCTNISVAFQQMENNARWKCKLHVFQPTVEFLQVLAEAMGREVCALVTYVEIACDINANSNAKVLYSCDEFLASAHMLSQQQDVVLEANKTNWYYGRRFDVKGKRRGNVLAVYASKPSKLLNARPAHDDSRCLHIEWRIKGSGTMSRFGILTITDLIQFDFPPFFNKNIIMYQLPKYQTDLGYYLRRGLANLRGANTDVSDEALRKRARKWKAEFSIDNHFILHNALRKTPGIGKKFTKISFMEWLKNTVICNSN